MASARALGGAVPISRTSYIGKGRGRGKLAPKDSAGDGTQKPGQAAAGSGEPQTGVGRVLHVIATAPSSVTAESLAERVSQEAEVCITTGDEITQLAQSLYKWTLESPERASHVAIVCNTFGKLEKDGVKFRSPFLQPLKKDFDTREDWRHGDENRWLSLACLLCQFFKEFKVMDASGTPGSHFHALEEPTFTCLEMLLASPSLKSHVYGVTQLIDLGPILYALKPYKIDEIMDDLRRRLLASDTLSTSRMLFLEALEFYAGGWQMDESSVDYYANKKSVASI